MARTFPIPAFPKPLPLERLKVLPLAKRLHAERPFDVLDAQFFYPDGPAVAKIAKELRLPFSIKARGADIHHWGHVPYANRMMRAAASSVGSSFTDEAERSRSMSW